MLEVWRKEQKNTKQIDHGMSSIEINEEMFKIKWSIKRHCFANVRTLGLTDTLEPLEQPKVSWFILPFLKDLSNTIYGQPIKRSATYGYEPQKIYSLTCPFWKYHLINPLKGHQSNTNTNQY